MTIERAIELLRQGDHELHPHASEEDVQRTESALARRLPPSFRTFVTTFSNGAHLNGVQEVSAVGDGNPQIMPIQKIDRISANVMKAGDLVPFYGREGSVRFSDLIPFSLDSNGNEWCFLSGEGESQVAYLGGVDEYRLFGRLGSFPVAASADRR